MSNGHPLFRFLNREMGPIVKLQTQEWGKAISPFFYSKAQLSPQISRSYRVNDLLGFGGGGWSRSRLESQEKAITEAIERWAFLFCMENSFDDVGLELDPTSNGFAALPAGLGEDRCFLHSACEAIERYILCSIWEQKNVQLKPLNWRTALSVGFRSVFTDFLDGLVLYEYSFLAHSEQKLFTQVGNNWGSIKFVLALRFQHGGGVVCGSACGIDSLALPERAALEAFNHQRVLNAFKANDLPPGATITDQRLLHFGRNRDAELRVKETIDLNVSTNEVLPRPEFTLVKKLQGPWLPEVMVTRVLVANSLPITEGDQWRFLI